MAMGTAAPAFEIIAAEPENAITLSVLYETPEYPSDRIVLFFSLLISLVIHLMLLSRPFAF
jgi:hypothetical protein